MFKWATTMLYAVLIGTNAGFALMNSLRAIVLHDHSAIYVAGLNAGVAVFVAVIAYFQFRLMSEN